MNDKNNSVYIDDILDSINKIYDITKDVKYDEFKNDYKINYVVVRCLEIIGESTNKLNVQIKSKYKNIPWENIYKTRNIIVNAYDKINPKIIWDTIKEDIPELEKVSKEIKSVLEKEQSHKEDKGIER